MQVTVGPCPSSTGLSNPMHPVAAVVRMSSAESLQLLYIALAVELARRAIVVSRNSVE